MAPAPIPQHIANITRPRESLFTYYILKAIASNVAIFFVLPYLYFRFHTMRYRFDEEGIHMSWGIIFRREIMLTYARIQDIHLTSNLIERWLGLARIQIQTASGSSGSDLTLEGIQDPEAMRDFLYSRMRGAHHQDQAEVGVTEGLAAILTEIASELREIRIKLEGRRA
jgi:putative membrane protein